MAVDGGLAGLLLLADSRLPSGAHAHSGGLEAAAGCGWVREEADLRAFLAGRLATAGLTAAAFTAFACGCAAAEAADSTSGDRASGDGASGDAASAPAAAWRVLDAELDARTPSPGLRRASRTQGRGLMRAARRAWPPARGEGLLDRVRDAAADAAPHHPVVLGACAWLAGGSPGDAAALAAYGAVTAPASAAVRLLGFDPLGVHACLVALAGDIDAVAAAGARAAEDADGDAAELPGLAAPGLDLLAGYHQRSEVRLFES